MVHKHDAYNFNPLLGEGASVPLIFPTFICRTPIKIGSFGPFET